MPKSTRRSWASLKDDLVGLAILGAFIGFPILIGLAVVTLWHSYRVTAQLVPVIESMSPLPTVPMEPPNGLAGVYATLELEEDGDYWMQEAMLLTGAADIRYLLVVHPFAHDSASYTVSGGYGNANTTRSTSHALTGLHAWIIDTQAKQVVAMKDFFPKRLREGEVASSLPGPPWPELHAWERQVFRD